MAKKKSKTIPLDKGFEAHVDADCHAEVMSMGEWYVLRDAGTKRPVPTLAVKANGRKTTIGLHRFIARAPKGTVVFFLDGDSMNCTRENLLVCTPNQAKLMKKMLSAQSRRLRAA